MLIISSSILWHKNHLYQYNIDRVMDSVAGHIVAGTYVPMHTACKVWSRRIAFALIWIAHTNKMMDRNFRNDKNKVVGDDDDDKIK